MKVCPLCQRCFEDDEASCPSDGGVPVPARAGGRMIAEKYRLDRLLARGGMGAVYEATHVALDRPVAIKTLLTDFMTEPEALERFRREARAAARVSHPNLAGTYDYGTLPDGGAYIVMELVRGKTLRERLDTEGRFSPAEAAEITRQVAEGVEAAHRSGILHRDLKPSNILLTPDGDGRLRAKVVDFGVAKTWGQAFARERTLTVAGTMVGTPRYMSPEQCAGEELDARSDVYSLGVILYEMLTGQLPFDAPTQTAVALKHLREPPPPVTDLRPELPAPLARLTMRALEKGRGARFQSAGEMARELAAIGAAPAGGTTPVGAGSLSAAAPGGDRASAEETTVRPPARSAVAFPAAAGEGGRLPAAGGRRKLAGVAVLCLLAAAALAIWAARSRRLGGEAGTPAVARSEAGASPAAAKPDGTARAKDPRAELAGALEGWIGATNAADLDGQMDYYLPRLDTFYLAKDVSRSRVRAEKERVFAGARRVEVRAGEPEIDLGADGGTATVRFRKQYVIEGGRTSRRGEVLQEVRWRLTPAGWRIASERDVRVIR